jgi:mycofactocin precursor peptide peptidase
VTAKIDDLASPELTQRGTDLTLLVPIGATEQHGPHLPLNTDTEIATAIATEVVELDAGTVLAPALPYGASGEHADFAGTLSIGTEATALLLLELGRSACATFRQVVFVSGHGGNGEAVTRATRQLNTEGRPTLAWSPRWHSDAHAGRAETSIMLALRPEAVRLERAQPGNTAPLQELWPALRRGGVAAVSANGVLGDPAGASADEGRRLLTAAVEDLRLTLQRWADPR